MSAWTHVAGIVRIDALRLSGKNANEKLKTEIKEILGEPKDYHELEIYSNDTANTRVPYGSEGSLDYEIRLNNDYNMLPAGYISIFGDLRNFGGEYDQERILNWLRRLSSNFVIRQGIVHINDDYEHGPVIFYFNDNEWQRRR